MHAKGQPLFVWMIGIKPSSRNSSISPLIYGEGISVKSCNLSVGLDMKYSLFDPTQCTD